MVKTEFLDHLVKHRVRWEFEVGECLMVSSNSFDVVGARACGMRGAYVNRYRLPYEDTPYQPDLTVGNFTELADALTTAQPLGS